MNQLGDLLDKVSFDLVKAAQTSAGTDVEGDSVDMKGYDGVVFFCTIATHDADNFLKAQQSEVSGSGFSDLAGSKRTAGASGQVAVLSIYRPSERYVRPVVDRGGTNTATGDLYAVRYSHKDGITAHAAEVVTLFLNSPDEGTP